MRAWIDVSLPLRTGMAGWPGDPEVTIERVEEIGKGGEANLSRMTLGLHAGTHIDAPLHFLENGAPIDSLPADTLVGPARVIAVDEPVVTAEELRGRNVREGERVLFRTRNSRFPGRYAPDLVGLDPEAAVFLAASRVRAVGIDGLSISRAGSEAEVHQALLGAGIWVVEGLDLSAVAPGDYELICLPLLIPGAEAAPARAFLRPK
jgi:arylformamidase